MQSRSCMRNFMTQKVTPLYVTAQIVLYCCMDIISRIDIIECHVMTLWTRAFIVFKGTVGYFHGTKKRRSKDIFTSCVNKFAFYEWKFFFCCLSFQFFKCTFIEERSAVVSILELRWLQVFLNRFSQIGLVLNRFSQIELVLNRFSQIERVLNRFSQIELILKQLCLQK